MNLKLLLFIVLFFGLNGLGFSQQDNNWDTWNENYPLVDIVQILKNEYKYARELDKVHSNEVSLRMDKFRFKSTYLGKTRSVTEEELNVMDFVSATKGINKQIQQLNITTCGLFKVGDSNILDYVSTKSVCSFRKRSPNK
ncbi:MAG: hypothetical protein ORN85_03795 [Sediminibacterium sp.]|nr:hypothetical protein [Sediminibacterium sp.]